MSLIEDILDFAKMQSGSFSLYYSEVETKNLLKDSLELVEC